MWPTLYMAGMGAAEEAAATLNRTSDQTIGAGGEAVSFESMESPGNANIWSVGSATRVYPPSSGWYVVEATIAWQAGSTAIRGARLRVNAGSPPAARVLTEAGQSFDSTVPPRSSLVVVVKLTAGDYLDLVAVNRSASDETVKAARLSIARISGGVGAELVRTTTQSLASNVSVPLSFDSVVVDDSSFYSGAQPTRLTVPSGGDGWYLITTSLLTTQTGNAYLNNLRVMVNGVLTSSNCAVIGAIANVAFSTALITKLSAGDIVTSTFLNPFGAGTNTAAANGAMLAMCRMPGSVGVYASSTTAQTVASGGTLTIEHETENLDESGYYDPGEPSKIYAPSTGWYVVTGMAVSQSNASGTRLHSYGKDGSGSLGEVRGTPNSNSPVTRTTAALVVRLSSGSYVSALFSQDSGSTMGVATSDIRLAKIPV